MVKDSKTADKKKKKRLKNLKSFKKGQSGNLKGRPKGSKNLTTILKEYINANFTATDPLTKKKSKKTMGEWVCLKLVGNGAKGDIQSIKVIFDRLEGKVVENINMRIDESASIEAIKKKMHLYFKRNQRNEKEK